MQAADIPDQFTLVWGENASGTYIRVVPATTSDPAAASLSLGFPPATATPTGAGGVPPDVRDMNGALNQCSAWAQWLGVRGPVLYDSALSTAIGGYPKGTILDNAATNGTYWLSTVDDNTSDPDTGGANWTAFTLAGAGTSDTQDLSANGYQWTSGLLRQWGYYAGGSSNPTITFPIAFPTACWNVKFTPIGTGATTPPTGGSQPVVIANLAGAPSLSGFSAYLSGEHGDNGVDGQRYIYRALTTVPFFWEALGN